MTPAVGDRVRLVGLHGVSSETLRAQVGKEGVVTEVRSFEQGVSAAILVAFEVSWKVFDRFWLRLNEIELVGPLGRE